MLTIISFLIGLVLMSGSTSTTAVAQGPPAEGGAPVSVTGTLTDQGVPCWALRGDDGVLYTFRRTPETRQFKPGDRIRVEGRIVEISICQQGTTVVVSRTERVE
jgi:hypothetical protein